ncbi:MAG: hypothetical protein KKH98_11160 [Spirochaetes bacterium]|nr:hypothetical protein [Spirochaetota bacterium]
MFQSFNLIALLFFLPVIISIILILFRSRLLNVLALFFYSCMFLIIIIRLYIYPQSYTSYFQADSLNIFFLLILGIVFFCVALYNIHYLLRSKASLKQQTIYTILFIFFILSMTAAFLSQHLGLLWVFIEATTLMSAPLINFEKSRSSLEATWKYIFICSIGISLAFVGIILLSISTGEHHSLFFNDLYKNAGSFSLFWLKLSFPFIIIGFGTKMGLAPVHAWLPDAHSEAPSPVSAMLSGTLLNAALFSVLKINKILRLASLYSYSNSLFFIMGFLSVFVSTVFILKAHNYKRMLAYSSIENMGIIMIGLALGGAGAFAAFLHILAHSFSKVLLFLTSGNILHLFKTKEIHKVNGLLKRDRLTGWLWILGFIFIAGFPPGPVFISELLMVKAFLLKKFYLAVVILIFLLTVIIYGLAKAVFNMSFGQDSLQSFSVKVSLLDYLPQIILIILLFVIGCFMPDVIYKLIQNCLMYI